MASHGFQKPFRRSRIGAQDHECAFGNRVATNAVTLEGRNRDLCGWGVAARILIVRFELCRCRPVSCRDSAMLCHRIPGAKPRIVERVRTVSPGSGIGPVRELGGASVRTSCHLEMLIRTVAARAGGRLVGRSCACGHGKQKNWAVHVRIGSKCRAVAVIRGADPRRVEGPRWTARRKFRREAAAIAGKRGSHRVRIGRPVPVGQRAGIDSSSRRADGPCELAYPCRCVPAPNRRRPGAHWSDELVRAPLPWRTGDASAAPHLRGNARGCDAIAAYKVRPEWRSIRYGMLLPSSMLAIHLASVCAVYAARFRTLGCCSCELPRTKRSALS